MRSVRSVPGLCHARSFGRAGARCSTRRSRSSSPSVSVFAPAFLSSRLPFGLRACFSLRPSIRPSIRPRVSACPPSAPSLLAHSRSSAPAHHIWYRAEYYNGQYLPISRRGYVMTYNRIVGKIRLRQLRVAPDAACQLSAAVKQSGTTLDGKGRRRQYVEHCYGRYTDMVRSGPRENG